MKGQMDFTLPGGKTVTTIFDGGKITTDAGILPIREYDHQTGFTERIVRLLADRRDPTLTRHKLSELLRLRLLAIIAGYEDANDADFLRHDPAMQVIVGRTPDDGPLASQPTLSRFENAVSEQEVMLLNRFILDHYLDRRAEQARPSEEIIIDGIRERFPQANLILRSDAAGASPDIYRRLEARKAAYLIGLGRNPVLERRVERLVAKAVQRYRKTKQKVRYHTSFWYRARSWERSRRVLAKVEYCAEGLNLRFVVTSLRRGKARELFELYNRRGECENWIKEFKLGFKGDRLSCHRYIANAFRLMLYGIVIKLTTEAPRSGSPRYDEVGSWGEGTSISRPQSVLSTTPVEY